MSEKLSPDSLEERIKHLEQQLACLEEENEQLRADRDLFRLAFEHCPFSLQIYHKDGTQLAANKTWEKLWNLTAADSIGVFNALQDEQARELGSEETFRRVADGERINSPPLEFIPESAGLAGGRNRWASRYFYPLQDQNGTIERLVIIEEDFTEYMQSKEALEKNHGLLEKKIQERTAELLKTSESLQHAVIKRKEAEREVVKKHQQLLSIFDSIDEVIYIADPQTHEILYANKSLIKVFGDIRGTKCYRALQDRDTPCSFCNNDRILGRNFGKTQYRNFKNKRNNRLYRCIDKAIKWPDGRIVRYEMAIDITEQARMEKRLRQAQKMEAIGTLAAGIAHDFNNILHIIYGYAELLKSSFDDVTTPREIDGILLAADRAADLVRQILTFSRQAKQEKRPMLLQQLIKEALQLQQNILPDNIRLHADFDENRRVISSDPVGIHQLVTNLVTNACTAMADRGGTIEVHLAPAELPVEISRTATEPLDEKYVKLTVRDTGKGIPPAIIDKIFDPYFSTKPRGQGSGLGLSIAHGIVRDHGGYITVNSTPGEGTVFAIYFPLLEEEVRQGTPAANPSRTPADGTLSILYVDDEELNIMSWQLCLEESGFTVTAHTDPCQALEEFSDHPQDFDLIITDQKMPHLTGIDLAEKLTHVRSDIPIILISGWIDETLEGQSKNNGVTYILPKPHNLKQLLQAIEDVTAGAEE